MSETVHRIGLLVPSSDGVAELDFKNLLPRNVSFHTGRLYHHDSTPRGFPTLDEIVGHTEEAIRTILQVDPELIAFACTSGSFYRGVGWEKQIADRVRAASGVPAVVTATAVIDALQALNAQRIYMLTPYPEDINKIEIQFLRDSGVEVTGHTYFHCAKSKEISNILPNKIIERVLSVRGQIEGCDGLLISCTGLRGSDAIVPLESELGIPVVTSNAATVWATLRQLGLSASGIAGGQLFALAESRPPMVA
jgi:maleate isomerase